MKTGNIILAIAITLAANTVSAQQVTVEEPEFMNSYCLLTSDSTYVTLPKEGGTVKQHKSWLQKAGEIAGYATTIAGAAGGIAAVNSNSITGMVDGMKVMGTAANASGIADAVSGLAAVNGQDIVFKGANSPYTLPAGMKNVRLVIKAQSNEYDPMELYRIVRFTQKKKERRIRWMEFSSSLLGSIEKEEEGYVNFTGHKYGVQSYLLTIPESELKPGEYGIFYVSIASATEIPVGTFSLK